MKTDLTIVRKLAWLICLCAFVLSCDQASEPPAKPKVVRKKIIVKKDKQATTRKAEKANPSKAKPAAQQPQKQQVSESKQPDKAQQKPEASPVLIADKDKSKPAKKPAAQPAKKSSAKPAISPKSDIAAPEQTVATKQPAAPKPGPDAKALKEDAKAAAEVFTTEKQMPSMGIQLTTGSQPPRYNPKGKVDPFEPLFKQKTVVAKKAKKKQKKRVPRTPLERIDLSQLKLVAIVLAKSGNRAMVEESSGKGYIISKGTYIGTNSGKVTNIQRHKVIVAEEIEDVMGNVSIRKTELKLPKPPGEL
jgi:type IV pilus assembly protein PilP